MVIVGNVQRRSVVTALNGMFLTQASDGPAHHCCQIFALAGKVSLFRGSSFRLFSRDESGAYVDSGADLLGRSHRHGFYRLDGVQQDTR